MKKILFLLLSSLMFACNDRSEKSESVVSDPSKNIIKFFSKDIKDSFSVFISLPDQINKNKTYPVIFLTDANLYFDIFATTVKHYCQVGMLPEAIVIGIGYKDFQTLDSLRDRDLTYPVAIPEYEMPLSGQADKFLDLIQKEIVPYVEAHYPCDKTKRVLMGHSLGGYFTLFALQKNLLDKNDIFCSYIAASPSADYNHNYILDEFEKLIGDHSKLRSYVTFGGLEDEQAQDDTTALKCAVVLEKLKTCLKEKNKIIHKGDIYSNLEHMDTGLPTFIKGIQWCLMLNK